MHSLSINKFFHLRYDLVMFSLFASKKNNPAAPEYTAQNPLFDLFKTENCQQKIKAYFSSMQREENQKIKEETDELQIHLDLEQRSQLKRLQFPIFNLKLSKEDHLFQVFSTENKKAFIAVSIERPNSSLKDLNAEMEFPMYRDWMRDQVAHLGGGLIEAECIEKENMIIYKCIVRIPVQNADLPEYHCFLNINNLLDDQIELVRIGLPSLSSKRKDIIHQFILSELSFSESDLQKYQKQDPYLPHFSEADVFHISELSSIDPFFPSDSLSLLRNQILPLFLDQLTYDLQFDNSVSLDIEVDYEEL